MAVATSACGGGESSSSSPAAGGSASSGESTDEKWPIESVGRLRGPKLKAYPPKGPLPKKLVIRDIKIGRGEEAEKGKKVTIQFTAVRFNGEPFESSWEFGHPFRFELGNGEVSPGWERGLPGMKVGGQRELLVPWKIISQTGILPDTGRGDGQVYVIDLLDVS